VTWTAPAVEPVDGPLVGPDRPIIRGYLDFERATLANICAGLTGEQLALRPLPSSNLSLLGLVRHLAKVERTWFRIRAGGEPIEPLYDLALGKDHDFDHLDPAEAEAALDRWREECRRGDEAAARLEPDASFEHDGETMSLGLVYAHMLAEYARHNGHADLLREAIDGVTGR
jgi:uncharacterized damage-inducible protein DinB